MTYRTDLKNWNLSINYWIIRTPDPGMTLWAKKRMELIFPKIISIINESCEGAFQRPSEQNTLDGTDQRLDFMRNAFRVISTWSGDYIKKLDTEIERRKGLGKYV